MSQKKVSCLCLTRNRTKFLHRAIRCFRRQTWSNKELVIVYDFDDKKTEKFLQHFADKPDIKLVKNTRKKPSVGFLRNLSVNNATGPFVMQWDDDDFFADNRIKFMMKKLKQNGKPAIVLNSWYCVFLKNNTIRKASRYTYEGTILAKKVLLKKFPYPNWTRKRSANGSEIGEDTAVIRKLRNRNKLAVVHNPSLYYYFIHGTNTCSKNHFRRMYRSASPLPGGRKIFNKLMERLAKDDAKYKTYTV